MMTERYYYHAIRYFLFGGEEIFVSCQNFWCQGIIKDCSNSCHHKTKCSIQSYSFKIWKLCLPLAALISQFIRENTSLLQPVAKMPTEQKTNINAFSACCDKRGAVCNDSLGQSINRSIKCYYWSR